MGREVEKKKVGERKSRTAWLVPLKKKKEVSIKTVEKFPWVVVVVLRFLIRDTTVVTESKLKAAFVT